MSISVRHTVIINSNVNNEISSDRVTENDHEQIL